MLNRIKEKIESRKLQKQIEDDNDRGIATLAQGCLATILGENWEKSLISGRVPLQGVLAYIGNIPKVAVHIPPEGTTFQHQYLPEDLSPFDPLFISIINPESGEDLGQCNIEYIPEEIAHAVFRQIDWTLRNNRDKIQV